MFLEMNLITAKAAGWKTKQNKTTRTKQNKTKTKQQKKTRDGIATGHLSHFTEAAKWK